MTEFEYRPYADGNPVIKVEADFMQVSQAGDLLFWCAAEHGEVLVKAVARGCWTTARAGRKS